MSRGINLIGSILHKYKIWLSPQTDKVEKKRRKSVFALENVTETDLNLKLYEHRVHLNCFILQLHSGTSGTSGSIVALQ